MTPKDEPRLVESCLSKRLRATRDHADTWWVSLCEEAADALDERDARIATMMEALESISIFARDCINTGHDRGALGNLYAICDLCDRCAALAKTERSETGGSV